MLVGLIILVVLGLVGSVVSPSSGDSWIDRSGGHRH